MVVVVRNKYNKDGCVCVFFFSLLINLFSLLRYATFPIFPLLLFGYEIVVYVCGESATTKKREKEGKKARVGWDCVCAASCVVVDADTIY